MLPLLPAALLLTGLTGTAGAGPELRCHIAMEPRGALVEITGIVEGAPGTVGRYVMSVRSTSGGNVSVSNQAGRFGIGKSGSATLSRSLVGMAGGHMRAEVTVSTGGATAGAQKSFDCIAEK